MPQIFPRSANALARASVFVALFLAAAGGFALWTLAHSGYVTREGIVLQQPVPFSHDHHVAQVGIDCRYCHTSVERAASAGIPPTQTCMNCHKTVRTTSEKLTLVRQSAETGVPIHWVRVHDLPDFVYFNHAGHVQSGVGCVSCHGRVDRMEVVEQVAPLTMGWCLDCHRNPDPNLRPRDQVTAMDWVPEGDAAALGAKLRAERNIAPSVDCATCHR